MKHFVPLYLETRQGRKVYVCHGVFLVPNNPKLDQRDWGSIYLRAYGKTFVPFSGLFYFALKISRILEMMAQCDWSKEKEGC